MGVRQYYGDISALNADRIRDLGVDIIVIAANTDLQLVDWLAAAIGGEGGPSIQEECNRIGRCELGSAVATGAGELAARHIIHVPTIASQPRRLASLRNIERGTRAALDLARDLGAKSIAFPLLGIQVLNIDQVAQTMTRVMADFEELDIVVCVDWQRQWRAVASALSGKSGP